MTTENETCTPAPVQNWEGAEEWMPLAWELCANECGEDACTELIWEGGPIPEPWGDRWLKYEDQAKEMIAMVRASLAAIQAPEGALRVAAQRVLDDCIRLSNSLDGSERHNGALAALRAALAGQPQADDADLLEIARQAGVDVRRQDLRDAVWVGYTAASAAQPTRGQRLRDAGYTRRPSWKSLPGAMDGDEAAQAPAEAHGWPDAADWLERESKAVYGVCLDDHAEAAQWLRDTSTASQPLPKAAEGDAVAWMWQHDETGRTGFVDCWQVENGWQEQNPRLRLVHKLYAHPQPKVMPVAWTLRETLDKAETTTRGYLWFTDPKNSAWAPLYAAPVQAPAPAPEPHGWIVWWPAMGGGHKPVYTHGAQKPSYGPELGSKLRLYPVYDAPCAAVGADPAVKRAASYFKLWTRHGQGDDEWWSLGKLQARKEGDDWVVRRMVAEVARHEYLQVAMAEADDDFEPPVQPMGGSDV